MSDHHAEVPSVRKRRLWFIAIWITASCAGGAILFLLFSLNWNEPDRRAERRNHAQLFKSLADGDAHPQFDPARYVWDRACFLRPRADVSIELRMGPIGGRDEIPYTIRHVQWGVVRAEPLPEAITQPAILVVGDSHLYGFCDVRDNAASVLEELLHRRGFAEATVANGSCPYYSLYQVTQRMRTLIPQIGPRVCIAAVFVGNDLIELEDVGRSHLDDALQERFPDAHPPPETTSARRAVYNRCHPRRYGELFWQGMNQAIYLYEQPQRYPVLLAKARRCFELMAAACREHDAELLVVLIPSYDDYLDFKLPFATDATMGPILAEQTNRRLREDLLRVVQESGITALNAWPAFHDAGEPDMYAGDFHIWKAAHRILAEMLAPAVTGRLESND